MKRHVTKEIPIVVRKEGDLHSPHVLDLRALRDTEGTEEARVQGLRKDETRNFQREERVEKGEEHAYAAAVRKARLNAAKQTSFDSAKQTRLESPLAPHSGDEQWMQRHWHARIPLEERPRSFQLWQRRRGRRPEKHKVKLNFYRAVAPSPEEQIAEMVSGVKGWWINFARGARKGMVIIGSMSSGGMRAVKRIWGEGARVADSISGFIVTNTAQHIETAGAPAIVALREEMHDEEEDDAPVALWRRAEVMTLIGLTLGLLLVVKTAGAIDEWRDTRGKVLGAAVEGVEALVAAHDAFSNADMTEAINHFLVAQERFAAVSDSLASNVVTSALGSIPPYKSGVALVALGTHASRAAEHVLLGLKRLDEARIALDQGEVSVAAIDEFEDPAFLALPLTQLQQAHDELLLAEGELYEAQAAAAAIREEDIPQEYRAAVISLKGVLPPAGRLMAQARIGVDLLSSFFGADRPRRFLVIFQNDAELRPTGGFMGSYALVDAEKGRITSLSVPGGGFYDLKGGLTARVDAPYPFHLFSPNWQAWNANWFFDFPASARTIAWFMEKSQQPTIDGIITITPSILEHILALSGPVVLPDYNVVIDAHNVRRVLQDETEQNYDRAENAPKKIIADLVPIVIQRIPEVLTAEQGDALAFLAEALDRHDILVWSVFPEEEARIANAGWSGAAHAPTGDYLAVVHTNVGGGKTDRVFSEAWTRTVTFTTAGDGIATLRITRTHGGDPDDAYEKIHHVDYMRVFVPEGSALISAEGFNAPDPALLKHDHTLTTQPEMVATPLLSEDSASGVRISREHGLISFGGWVMTKVGQTSSVTITYRLPAVVKGTGAASLPLAVGSKARQYALTVQRQPGAPEADFTDTLQAPDEWGTGIDRAGNPVTGKQMKIDRDMSYRVVW